MKTHDPELSDQVLNAWEAIQVGLVDPLTLLHWPADEITPEELILDLGVEVGRKGVTVPLVVLLYFKPLDISWCSLKNSPSLDDFPSGLDGPLLPHTRHRCNQPQVH